jgi:hypothetical protein
VIPKVKDLLPRLVANGRVGNSDQPQRRCTARNACGVDPRSWTPGLINRNVVAGRGSRPNGWRAVPATTRTLMRRLGVLISGPADRPDALDGARPIPPPQLWCQSTGTLTLR